MKKLIIVVLLLGAGTVGLGVLHQATNQMNAVVLARLDEWQRVTNQLAELNRSAVALRDEVARKKSQLARIPAGPAITPELLALLKSDGKLSAAAEARLRAELEIGWNTSADYVLVNKSTLKDLNFEVLYDSIRPTDTARAVFGISREEQADIKAALKTAQSSVISQVERIQPSGDVVAQYKIQADADLQAALSNRFSTDIAGVLGAERAEFFVPAAWREFQDRLGPEVKNPVVFTLRKTEVDGEPEVIWEIKEGNTSSQQPVRYANYPSMWFLTLFPGGWEPIAEREGFALPKHFKN